MFFNRFVFLFTLSIVLNGPAAGAELFELVNFDTDDGGRIEASLFKAGDDKAVVFAHGGVFNKESWYFLAEEFQRSGVTALSIDFRGYGNSKGGSTPKKMYDVLGAISLLRERGFEDINVVGGSMGGAAVLVALAKNSIPINKVVLLAPAGGPAITSATTDKLFVVSADERVFSGVEAIYDASAEPKHIHIYPGSTHAQHLFKTEVRDELVERILNFIQPGQP